MSVFPCFFRSTYPLLETTLPISLKRSSLLMKILASSIRLCPAITYFHRMSTSLKILPIKSKHIDDLATYHKIRCFKLKSLSVSCIYNKNLLIKCNLIRRCMKSSQTKCAFLYITSLLRCLYIKYHIRVVSHFMVT